MSLLGQVQVFLSAWGDALSNSDSSSHLENRPCKYRRELLSTQRRQNYPERVNLMTNLIFDDDTRLMVSIFQKVFHLSSLSVIR